MRPDIPELKRGRLLEVVRQDVALRKDGRLWIGLCPFHADTTPSLTVDVEKEKYRCWSCGAHGDVLDWLENKRGLSKAEAISFIGGGSQEDEGKPETIAVYEYRDEFGEYAFEKVRLRWPSGKVVKGMWRTRTKTGGWKTREVRSGLSEPHQHLLYKLPDVIEGVRLGRPVYLCEGEKAADAMIRAGYCATSTPDGATGMHEAEARWHERYSQFLAGAQVVIVADRDEQGERHAAMVAEILKPVAAAVRVVRSKTRGAKDDAFEHFEAGYDVKDFEHAPELEAAEFPWTDSGNAERFRAEWGRDCRYSAAWKKWYVWDGTVWLEQEHSGWAYERAKISARRFGQTVDGDDGRKFARKSESADSLAKTIKLAGMLKPIAITGEAFDSEPMLLNCANGTLDLAKGKLRGHSRLDMLSRKIGVPFDATAECPMWEKFVLQAMAGDQEMADFLQRSVGYSLTASVKEQVFFFLQGAGGTGKSTFIDALLGLLGPYATIISKIAVMQTINAGRQDEEVVHLRGRRMAITSEVGERERFDFERIKHLTGDMRTRGRALWRDSLEFDATAKLWITGNSKPMIEAKDSGMWRRLLLIPFEHNFWKSKDVDRDFGVKLLGERPGILRWAVRGAVLWQQSGLKPPAKVAAATEEYREAYDWLGRCLETISDYDPFNEDWRTTPEELHAAYLKWCKETSSRSLSLIQFGMTMASANLGSQNIGGRRYFVGRRIKEQYAPSYDGVYRGGE